MIKLDEARLMLNRLMGPQGPLSMAERHKFLTQTTSGMEAPEENTINDRSAAFYTNGLHSNRVPIEARGLVETSSRAAAKKNDQSSSGARDDDEFWYQTPKDNQ